MNILVLGGTYFIGRRLIEKLIRGDYNVTLLNRGTMGDIFPGINTIKADRHNLNEMKGALNKRSFDVVIDISGYTQDDIKIVLDCLNDEMEQYIFCSSVAVCSRPPRCWPITEKHPKRSSKDEGRYGYNKWMAEKLLFRKWRGENLKISIVRPTYVYGPYDYSRRISYIFEKIKNKQPIIISGSGENIIQLGYVDDLTDAIIAILGNVMAYGEAFNISGMELVTIKQLIEIAANTLKGKANIVCLNGSSKMDNEICSLPNFHYFADITKGKEVLGLRPKTTLEEGMQITALWWLENEKINQKRGHGRK